MKFQVPRCVRPRVLPMAFAALFGAAACSGSITGDTTDDGSNPDSPRGSAGGRSSGAGNGGTSSGGSGGIVPSATGPCSDRMGRPAWQMSTNTAFQVRNIVSQVFGADALRDPQVLSAIETIPTNLKAKGFDTESKAVSGQFTDLYINLARRLSGLAAEQGSVRTAIESFAGKSCAQTVDVDTGCGLEMARNFASAVMRQRLSDADFDLLMSPYKANKAKYAAPKAYAGFIASVLLSAKSALRFDSAELSKSGTVDAHSLGSRLAMTLTGGLPDAALRAKIDDGSILKPDVIRSESKRLMRTPSGRSTLDHFAQQWLNLAMVKSPPGGTGYVATTADSALVARAARQEIGSIFQNTVLDKNGKLEDFFGTDDVVPSHDWLAKIYGTAKSDQITRSGMTNRKGLLTRVGFSLHGAFADYLPLAHRGYGVTVTMLCGTIGALPDNIDKTLPANAPDAMSSRQYFETLTERGTCNACHSMMNKYGYALSAYSVTGERLTKERVKSRVNSQLVDVDVRESVDLKLDDKSITVSGAGDLSLAIGKSAQGQACFAHRFDQYAVGVQQEFLCAERGSVVAVPDGRTLEDTILAYVSSAAFALR